jgi:hypothetical protein
VINEVRLRLSDPFVSQMRGLLGRPNITAEDVVREALTTYRWCAEQRSQGHVIYSGTDAGVIEFRLDQESLNSIRERATA